MTTVSAVDVFAQAGYSVATKLVDRVDNQGEPCEFCQTEGRYVDATVYGFVVTVGTQMAVDCCVFCVPVVISGMDPLISITVELGDSLDDFGDNGRMAHQDDTRPHPDAL